MNPMYLAYRPPQMLPTITMNPTKTAGAPKATGSSKVKRGAKEAEVPFNKNVIVKRREPINADRWWWIGVGMTALGGIGYFCF